MTEESPSFEILRQKCDTLKSRSDACLLDTYIPPTFTTEDLARELANPDDIDKPQRIRALRACLDEQPERLQDSGKNDRASQRQICRFAARVIAPIIGDDDEEDQDLPADDDRRDAVVQTCRSVVEDGVAVLGHITNKDTQLSPEDEDDAQLVFTLIAIADAGQPWTTKAAAQSATMLLSRLLSSESSSTRTEWIVEAILKGYLRKLFARPRPGKLTSSGRTAAFGDMDGDADQHNTESRQAKPWKHVDLRAVSVFAWALDQSDTMLLGQHWPLFTPVLLALLDDPDTDIRSRGLTLLSVFVSKLPDEGRLLRTTGLDRVLADAVFPTLLFLPRLTPEKESLQLLTPAYGALLAVAKAESARDKKAPGGEKTESPPPHIPPKPAATLLDRILRDGVYAGYFHASEYTRIVEVLLRQTGFVVEAMGVYAVKHLKDLIPMYAAVLTDPFAMRHTPTVEAAVGALQTTISSCWPRLAGTPWQEEITKMLVLCWLNVVEDDGDGKKGTRELKDSLARTADMLLAVMKAADVDVGAKIGPLVDKEPRLKGLFRTE